jgi:hypothetical membrane protein
MTTTATRVELRTRAGAILLVLGTVQFFVAHAVAQSAWPTPYSWTDDYISDLGAVTCGTAPDAVCSPLHAVANAAFVLQGVLLICGTALTGAAWTASRGRRVWRGLLVAAGASWIVVGLVPSDVDGTVHAAAALPGFLASNAALLVAGASRSTRHRPVCRRAATGLGVAGVVGLVVLGLASRWPGTPVGIGAAERLVVFPHQVWALVVGAALLLPERAARSRASGAPAASE